MSVTIGPQIVLDGPVPKPPLYRLLAEGNPGVEIIDDPNDPHWQLAAAVWSYPVDVPSVWDGCSTPGTDVKSEGAAIPLPVFQAYTVYFPMTCSMRGIDPRDIEGWQARAAAALLATESFAVERELSQGISLPLNPFFDDASVTLLNGGAVTSEKAALGFLVDAIGATGSDGVIHATPATVIGFTQLDIYRDRDNIFAADGTPMVRGAGYVGGEPSGGVAAGPGEAWAYATGPVKILRSPIYGVPDTPAEALDRENNVYTFMAERNYLAIWDTALQAAVLVDWTA